MKSKYYVVVIMLLLVSIGFGQTKKTITGSVKDLEGQPLLGATVLLEGTGYGTTTDNLGIFTISATEGDVLEISYVFYKTQKIKITSIIHYDIILNVEAEVLDNVIVVAYGTSTKESVTGSIGVVGNSEISKRPNTNVLNALDGALAGVKISNSDSRPGSEPNISIRGFSSLGRNSPLLVLDGVPFVGTMSDINPIDIENITVLKDASATTLYGSRASNGVVMITSKSGSKGNNFFNLSIKQGLYSKALSEYDRLGPNDFMETMWTGYRNSMVGGNITKEQANVLATRNLIPEILGMNIYNLPNSELFDSSGKLVDKAHVLPGISSDLDWYKPLDRTGMYQDINLSGRVANERGGAYFSGGFLNNEGYYKGVDYKRFTARVNADYKVNEAIKVGVNITGGHQVLNTIDGWMATPSYFARRMAPIYPVYLHDKNTGEYLYDEEGKKIYDMGKGTRKQFQGYNFILENELNVSELTKSSINGQIYGDFKFFNDFMFTLKGDMNIKHDENVSYANAVSGYATSVKGSSNRIFRRNITYSFQQLLKWNKSFGRA